MKKLFHAGIALLVLFEIANVYVIMPMPFSQRMRTIDVAYALFTGHWTVRAFAAPLHLPPGESCAARWCLGAPPGILTNLVMALHLAPVTKKTRRVVRETVSLYDAKTNLSDLVERAAAGAEIVIAKSGKPKALLAPLGDVRPLRKPGQGRGQWRVGRGFDAPLPADALDDFEP